MVLLNSLTNLFRLKYISSLFLEAIDAHSLNDSFQKQKYITVIFLKYFILQLFFLLLVYLF